MMGFFKGLLDWVVKGVLSTAGKKIIEFFIDVFNGATGEILDNTYKIINEVVCNVENIGEYIWNNSTTDLTKLSGDIASKYGVILSRENIARILVNKGEGKYQLAFEMIRARLEVEITGFNFERAKQAINLGIELAVNRFFGKV